MEIITLIKANIKGKKGAFTSVALLMLIITVSMTVILSITDNMNNRLRKSLDETGVGDIMATIPDQCATDTFFNNLKQNEYLDHFYDVETIVIRRSKINSKKQTGFMNIINYNECRLKYHFYNEKGTSYIKKVKDIQPGECYVPYCFKTSFKCEIDSPILINTKDGAITLTIKGFYEEPMAGAYVIDLKQVLVCSQDYEMLEHAVESETEKGDHYVLRYHYVHLYQKKPHKLDHIEFKKSLNESCKVMDYSYGILSKEDSVNYTFMLTKIFGNMMLVFVFLLFVVVLIVIGNSISTGIEMEYANLGVLKVIGFSKKKLRLVLVLEYVLAEIAGAFVGIILSLTMIAPMEHIFQMITGILAGSGISVIKCSILIAGILIVSLLYIYWKTRKVAVISPVRAISGGTEPVYFDHKGKMKMKRKAMSLTMVLRQLDSNRKQYLGIMMIVAILMYFLTSITILTRGIKVETVYEVFGGITSDVNLKMTDRYTSDRKEEILEEVNKITPVKSNLFSLTPYTVVDGNHYYTMIYDDPSQFTSVLEGRAPLYSNEVLVTETVSKMIGKGVGDTIQIAFRDKQEQYMISGIYQCTAVVGKCIGMSLEGARRIGDFEPTFGYLRVADSEKIDEVVKQCNETFGSVLEAQRSKNTDLLCDLIQLSLKVVTIWIYSLTIAFVLVVVIMTCKKTFLKERCDIGIYKSLGFTSRQLRIQFSLRFVFVSILGCIIGLIGIELFNSGMMTSLFSYIGIISYHPQIAVPVLIAPMLVITACFLGFSFVMATQIKKVAVSVLVTE